MHANTIPQELSTGLPFRMGIFAFAGIGWDALMTLLQHVIAGTLERSLLLPVSPWMFIAYGFTPLGIYPLALLGHRLGLKYPSRLLLFLLGFFVFELLFGLSLREFDIVAWNYNWNLDPRWTLDGIVTWHPAFLISWTLFVAAAHLLDSVLRASYPSISRAMKNYFLSGR